MAKNMKAQRAVITIADISLQGLVMPNGSYRMSDTDICKAIGEPRNSLSNLRQSKSVKALNDGASVMSEKPQKIAVEGISAKVNTSAIEVAAVYWAAKSSVNPVAMALTAALASESIERRFNRAVGKHVEEEEYDRILELRMKRLEARLGWTDVVGKRMKEAGYYSDKARRSKEFKELTVLVNMALFNQPHFCCDRDTMTEDQQDLIKDFERAAKRKAKQDPSATPKEIIDRALLLF